jgi:hypothetical protein
LLILPCAGGLWFVVVEARSIPGGRPSIRSNQDETQRGLRRREAALAGSTLQRVTLPLLALGILPMRGS